MSEPRSEKARRIADLTPEQRELLLRRLAPPARRADAAAAVTIGRLAAGLPPPLSFAQERAFFHDRLAGSPGARNIIGALRFDGELVVPALAAALAEIVRRHEPLRSAFLAPEGEPVLAVREPRLEENAPDLARIDLAGLPAEAREEEARRVFLAETRRPFDLEGGHLLRATLIRRGPGDHLLLLAMHHSAADGWSIGVLIGELAALYSAQLGAAEGQPPAPAAALPSLPLRYRDYAAWQRERVASGALAAGLRYWRDRLDEAPPLLRIRPDRAGPPAGAECRASVEPALREQLERLGRRGGATLFATTLTAFLALLMRCTGQQDLLIGSPVSGRTRLELEPLIGLFVNTVALRAQLLPSLTFREALGRVRETVLGALAHHEVPFEQVVRQLGPGRRADGQGLFEILFNFTPSPPRRLQLPGVVAQVLEAPEPAAELAMQLYVTEWEGALELRLVYAGGRYTAERMAVLLEQYHGILRQVAGDGEQRLGAFDLNTPASRRLLPDPALALPMPSFPRVAESIAAGAARTPQAVALEQGGAATSYAQLWAAMERTARRLQAAGLAPGEVVAVGGERGPAVVAAMAGILLAGGVLLTLSADLPEPRQRVMLAEARARFALVTEGGMPAFWAEIPGLVLVVTAGLGEPAAEPRFPSPEGHRDRRPAGREPAYVFFTSGSTGKPKGVLGNHAGLAHFLAWERETFAIGPGERCGQLTGLSFDVVLRDVFLPLTAGATLVFPREGDLASGVATLGWLEREKISHLHAVPAVAEMWLLEVPPEATLAALRRVLFAGEPLQAELVARWRAAFPAAGEIVNIYGPTETTLAKCFYRVPAAPLPGVQPVGRTLPQAQALLLTAERALCGIGEPGEIAIRTPFRSLGYLNAPEENARRFVPNLCAGDPDDLIYLTGDRGVYRADGLLEYLGRLDDQVKIRGVRVEPIEVATWLEACPGVAASTVVARDDGAGMALVAYVVAERGTAENAGRLLDFLRARLAAPMVPSAVVFLDRLPLTANHKVDRARLPAPDLSRPSLGQEYVAPRSAAEAEMARLWQELLGTAQVGIGDSFFDLGGHSLLAMRMLSRAERLCGRRLPLAAFFARPTIEHLMEGSPAEAAEAARAWPRVLSFAAPAGRPPLFLVHPGGGMGLAYAQLARQLAGEAAVHALQARGLDGSSLPDDDLPAMAGDYLAEIRALEPRGPYRLAGHSFGGVIAFEMARQLASRGEEVALLVLLDAAAPATPAGQDAADEGSGDAERLAALARAVGVFGGGAERTSGAALCELAAEEQIERVAEEISKLGLVPGAGAPLVQSLLAVDRAHRRAKLAYRPAVSPVPLLLVRARGAALASPEAEEDQTLGWSAHCAAPVEVLWTAGDHLTMLTPPHVDELGRILRSRLAALPL